MGNTSVNITLQSKSDPTINIQTIDGGSVNSSPNFIPTINFVATGPVGAQGAQGTQGADGSGGSTLTDDSVQTSHIINGAVTGAKIANYSVTASKLSGSAVSTTKLQNLSVTTAKLADNSVTAAKIANGAITNELIDVFADFAIKKEKIEYLGLDASVIALDAIITSKIKDRNVTGAKIESNPDLDGEVKAHNLKLKGSSPATLTGPDSDALQIKSNTTIDFLNTSGTTIASLDQSGNLTISGTVDNRNISTDGSKLDTISNNAEPNVKSNWNETDSNSDAFIQNKPTIPVNTDTTYNIQCVDGDNSNEQKIRLAASGSGSGDDDVVLEAGTGLSISRSGDKITFTNTVTDTDTVLTTEQVQDIVGAMFSGNTETRISASYQDGDGTIDLVVDAIPVDLTVDGAGTIHTNNVPTLNQNTTGNAATATALTSGNKTISGDLDVTGNLQFSSTDGGAVHIYDAQEEAVVSFIDGGVSVFKAAGNLDIGTYDLRAKSFTSDVATGQAPFTVSSTTEVANLRAATASALASGDQTINGNLAVTGTVDGIDIATDVAANTAKTSFPGFGTTAGTALEGNTTIPTQYTDSDAVSAVSTADNYLRNDASDTMSGSLTLEGSLFVERSDGGNTTKSKLINNSTTINRILYVPDASGTIALTSSNITGNAATATNLVASTSTAVELGTIELGHASDCTISRIAGGRAQIEGKEIQTTNKHRHFINFGINLQYPYSRWIPIGSYYILEQNTDSNPEYTTYVAPHDGKFIKALVRSEEALGDTELKIYKVGDGTEEPDQGSLVDDKHVDIASANTSYTYTFDSDATFSAGDALAIRIDPTNDPVAAGVVGTICFEFDLTT